MSRPPKLHLRAAVAVVIMSLSACNNLGLLDQLENPGSVSGKSGNSTVFLFATTNGFSGNIRGGMASARLAADVQCSTTRPTLVFPDNSCNQVRAVISVDASDAIANIPGSYVIPVSRSINGPNNFVIANDWGTLVAGTSGNNLTNGNVMNASTAWWSFSTLGGNFDNTNNCGGGTDNSTGNGATGNSSTAGNTWLSDGTLTCTASAVKLLCVCY